MRQRWSLLLAALFTASATGLSPAPVVAQHVAQRAPRPRRAPTVLTLWGTGTNVTANASTGVRFTVTTSDDASYALDGAFDAVNLFGRFDGPGRRLQCDVGVCLQFDGTVRFGADGSGFPEGTQTRFVLSVAINGTNASAVYHIGRIEGMPAEQYGLMALAVRR